MVGTEPADIFFFSLIILYVHVCVCVCVCEERKRTRLESVETALHCVVTKVHSCILVRWGRV